MICNFLGLSETPPAEWVSSCIPKEDQRPSVCVFLPLQIGHLPALDTIASCLGYLKAALLKRYPKIMLIVVLPPIFIIFRVLFDLFPDSSEIFLQKFKKKSWEMLFPGFFLICYHISPPSTKGLNPFQHAFVWE